MRKENECYNSNCHCIASVLEGVSRSRWRSATNATAVATAEKACESKQRCAKRAVCRRTGRLRK